MRRRPSPPPERERSLLIEGRRFDLRVRESARARRFRLTVGPHQPLELVVPRGAREREIDKVISDHRGWIYEQATRAADAARQRPALGLDRPGVVWIHLESEAVDAALTDGVAIERWYRREARVRITAMVEEEAERLGVTYTSIAIRDQRTRWGSCSKRGTLSFNWRLVIAPTEVCRYVVVHEVCHLRELNHSKAFWRLVDAAMPSWREQKRWLNENAGELHGYDPTAAR
jgi:predicted metal-dependent hydrolase